MQCCRGSNYLEVDVDVGSSRAANSVVGMVQGATSNMIIDLAGEGGLVAPICGKGFSPLCGARGSIWHCGLPCGATRGAA